MPYLHGVVALISKLAKMQYCSTATTLFMTGSIMVTHPLHGNMIYGNYKSFWGITCPYDPRGTPV